MIVPEIFHTVVPLLFLFLWIKFVPKRSLSYKWLPMWMIYPLVYVIYTISHGFRFLPLSVYR
ncbi:Pr6Pr family membrane protein [Algoriphagus sp. AGSA1]|uniref:Pr6Pr family membrane protein n=1 Tax=Algoriphagus sp. AGSA1 TaxID=2907213 RepID=UPI0034CE6B91